MVMIRVYTSSVRDINFKESHGKGVDLKKVMKNSNSNYIDIAFFFRKNEFRHRLCSCALQKNPYHV